MTVTICLGSSCHLKGSRRVVERLQYLINVNNLKDEVELEGTFCLGMCQVGVNVTVDGTVFSVAPESVDSFFETEILPRLNK
ncbi:MAG: (2Fe-2S) ferredoxin domain-containing protein [Clostridia bacterium]|nr:(2Fe-2S) ferredoxin domain-containing protein [Clostridia bacterium]